MSAAGETLPHQALCVQPNSLVVGEQASLVMAVVGVEIDEVDRKYSSSAVGWKVGAAVPTINTFFSHHFEWTSTLTSKIDSFVVVE